MAAATRGKAMNEDMRIYREYCWFALFLVILAIGFVGRPPPAGTTPHGNVAAAPVASVPPAYRTP
jgi:hypothetical protein